MRMAMLVLLTIGAALFAVDQWREATAKTVEAARLLVTAHVHLAQAHEEKALALLKEAEDSRSGRDYQRVWLQTLEAQRQPILGRDGLHAKARSRITNQMSTTLFADLWRSARMDTGSSVNGLVYSLSGELMATAQGDGSVRLWDAGSGEERARLAGEGGRVLSVAFSPDSQPIMRRYDIRPLFDPPERGGDKLDQLLRWLGEQDLEP